jgi:hypothetical protein|tara:strand:- start:97 stop:807 length:711 start_codon:yes stop_codon:yes gene_type:complete
MKKDKSIIGSILKGTLNITGEVIKTSYNVATSKEAIKFYKGTAVLTKDVVVGAAGLTKNVVDGAVDIINPSLKLKIIPHMENTLLLGADYKKVYKKIHDEVESGKSAEIEAEKFNKFKSHWLAIHTILLFDCIKNVKKDENLKEFNQLKKSDFDEIWDKVVLNTIKKRNPKAVQYIDKFYTNTFRVVDEEDVAKKLTVFLEECFGDEEVNKKNKNIILKSLKDTAIEYETSLIKLL